MSIDKTKIDDVTVNDALKDPKAVYKTLIFDAFWPNKTESSRTATCCKNKYKKEQVRLMKHYYSSSE